MRAGLEGILAVDQAGPVTLGVGTHPDGHDWNAVCLGELFELAKRQGIRQIWIAPGGLRYFDLPTDLDRENRVDHPFLEHGLLSVPKGQVVLESWMSVWDKDHFLEVSIPSWDSGSPFKSIEFGPALLGELLEFTDATGMLWKRSGAITSDAWLRDHFRKNGLLKATEYPEIAADGNLEPDLHYMRAPEGKELRASRLVAFDANAMYLGAMSSLALPVGTFRHVPPGGFPQKVGVGYWSLGGDRWVTSPTFSLMARSHDGALLWEESHRFLERLYKLLRDGRTKLLHRPDSAALEALKQVYRQGVGRFGSTRRSDPGDVLYQPYWRHAVQAEARCRLLRRIDSLAVKPVAVDVDCLYFLTGGRGDFHELFADKIGLPVDDQIGHFKCAGEMSGKEARGILSGEVAQIDFKHGMRRLEGLAALREAIR